MNDKEEKLDLYGRIMVVISLIILVSLIVLLNLASAAFDAHRDGSQNETTTEEETK
jgi:uncharacterized membrane protein